MENLPKLVKELCVLDDETSWVEFKHDNYEPFTIGEDICALANGATLEERQCAYFIWGVDDKSHEIVGTSKDLHNLKKGNEELENWLRRLLSNNIDFEYQLTKVDEKNVGVMRIQCAAGQPATFEKKTYIRVGSYTKKLADYPALQAKLWSRLQNVNFELQAAKENLDLASALQLLNYGTYFDLLKIPQPSTFDGVAHYLLEDDILTKQDDGLYTITKLGAILFAKQLKDFPSVSRKAIRLIKYEGNNRLNMLKEETIQKGYAVDFKDLIRYIEAFTATKEPINGALREKIKAFPTIEIRETVGNALIHQDFSITGTGPLIEIFDKRIEVTNPGALLVNVNRIIDTPPKSRNEKMASLMRRMRICEEAGTGWDKIIMACENAQLPAPHIFPYEESTRVTLYSEIPFSDLTQEDKLWACYMHACILQVQDDKLTNASLRGRFGLPETSAGSISRLIKKAVEMGMIKPVDESTSNRYMKYVPSWA